MDNKKSIMIFFMLLSTTFSHGADHPKRHRGSKKRRSQTMDLQAYSQYVKKKQLEKKQLIQKARHAEQVIPTDPQHFKKLGDCYKALVPFANNKAERKRWIDYCKQHEQRHAIMQCLYKTEYYQSSSAPSAQNLNNIKFLLSNWKKLQKTYDAKTEQFTAFQEKVFILEQAAIQEERALVKAAKKEAFKLKVAELQSAIQSALLEPNPEETYAEIHHLADQLFGRKSDTVLDTLPEMKRLAMKLGQTHWQNVMTSSQPTADSSSTRRTITRQEHARLKTRTSIAAISCQRDITPLERATALATLYRQLAYQSSEEAAQVALNSSHYYTKIKEQLLGKQKLEVLETAEDISTIQEAVNTALKLRDSFPRFHPKYSEYEQKALMLTLKVAHLEQDLETICGIRMNTCNIQTLNYADLLLDRLCAEKVLDEATTEHKPYNDIRKATLTLISTYNAEDNAHQHLITKLLRSDLRNEIETLQEDHTIRTMDRYKKIIYKLNLLIATYPNSHPKVAQYKKTIATLQTLKQIEFHKFTINNNKDQPLNRLRAYALQKSYARLAEESDKLIMSTSESQTSVHITELGDLLERAQHYAHQVTRFDLLDTLNTIEQSNPEANQEIIDVLDQLIALPIVNLHEKDELIAKRTYHDHCRQQKTCLCELERLESAKEIDCESCITIIKRVRTLTTLSLEEILLLEKKLDKYQTLLNK